MSNRITVIGTIATAPHMIGNDPARSLCTFRLASNERRYDREKGEWIDGTTNWFTVNVFRTLGDHAKESFSTGDRVLITGRLRVRRWENEGKSGNSVEIDAEALGHDLRWGVSRFARRGGARPQGGAEQAAAAHPAGSHPAGAVSGFEAPDSGTPGFGSAVDSGGAGDSGSSGGEGSAAAETGVEAVAA